MTGPPPPGLRPLLPDGEPRPAPAPEPIAYLQLPCVYEDYPGDHVVVTMLAEPSVDLAVALAVAERRLPRVLR